MANATSKDDNFMDVGAPMYPSSVVSNPLDLSKLNPAGIGSNPEVTEKYMQALQAQNKVADDLENRYKDINLAKIAAALASLKITTPLGTNVTFNNPPDGNNNSPSVVVIQVNGRGTYEVVA
jgi:hypothetical protein